MEQSRALHREPQNKQSIEPTLRMQHHTQLQTHEIAAKIASCVLLSLQRGKEGMMLLEQHRLLLLGALCPQRIHATENGGQE